LSQSLDLYLAPRVIQMLKILNLPYLELVHEIVKESEDNVMLEVERQDEYVAMLQYLTSDKKIKNETDFSELPGLKNFARVDKNLEDFLLEQVENSELEDKNALIAKELIANIDDHGYLVGYPLLRDKIMQDFDVSRPTVDKVLKVIQQFEPEGVAARDLKECLLIQVAAYDFDHEQLRHILQQFIENHLTDLEQAQYQKIATALGLDEKGVKEIANFIHNNLNPYPGANFGGESRMVIPSFAIDQTAKGFVVTNLEKRYGPSITISRTYQKMLEDPKTDAKTKNFLKERLKRAKELLEDFQKRGETLEKIVRKIIDSQQAFLKQGLIWLQPLTQKSLADEFGLHPSTISRAVAEKYIQTPQGLFPLKLLCPRGPKGATVAKTKSLIVELIKNEAGHDPLTDEQLTLQLQERGIQITRRTVAFYRQELKLGPAGDRRKP